ncbi:hypothetical protein R0K04_25880, partial [Pseudoalteromonas sp. SIMBA_153]
LATDNANNDFGGIDFDLPISQTDNIDAASHQSIEEEEEENNDIAISEPIDSLEVSVPFKGNLLTRLYALDELTAPVETQSIYVDIP